MKTPIDLLDLVREQRRRRGMSQAQLGHLLKMPQSQIARIERGSDIRLSTFLEVARALDLEPMLVPKHVVPAVRYMIEAPQHGSASRPKLVGNEPDESEDNQQEHVHDNQNEL
jgi:HTH-type transcriptional regulator / antitoxin HipB